MIEHSWVEIDLDDRDRYQSTYICSLCGDTSGWVSEDELDHTYGSCAGQWLEERYFRRVEVIAARRLRLLRELEELRVIESAMCPMCGFYEHGPDCELAKELANDNA